MARVPFIGRLSWREYLALFASLVLVGLEVFIRIITLGLPQPVIQFCYRTSRKLFNRLSSPKSRQARSKKRSIYNSIANCADFTELCALYGYYAEEHVVQTKDGYLLGIHRLAFRKGEELHGGRTNAGPGSTSKPVVYLHHGLLMNSEIWVCLTDEERCLPFALVNQGYDVWLGNNRGNKYSKKSTHSSPSNPQFWDFSMDEFAFYDIPNTIDYILDTTSQSTLSYIGFSQGTAQAFATLSIHPGLNEKVNVFIALAPAMSPAGLSNGIVDAFVKTSPDVLFLAFGRKSILSSATMWQSILYPPIFVRVIDLSLSFLFAWYSRNMTVQQKLAAYPHLYSFTSTKSVVHWFQIIRNKSFQMYDDDAANNWGIGARNRYYKVAKFPTRNIKTPIVLVYGGSDSLIDIRVMLRELPKHTLATEIPHFEHLDFLWAQEVDTLVFPHVFEALKYYAHHRSPNGAPQGLALSNVAQIHRRRTSDNLGWSDDEMISSDAEFEGVSASESQTDRTKSFAAQERERQYNNLGPRPRQSSTASNTSSLGPGWFDSSTNNQKDRESSTDENDTSSKDKPTQQNGADRVEPTLSPVKEVASRGLDEEPSGVESQQPNETEEPSSSVSPVIQTPSKSSQPSSTAGNRQKLHADGNVSGGEQSSSTGSGRNSPAPPVVGLKGIKVGASKPSVGAATP